ncbi:MAG: hypothetical protein KKH94_04955 [Candidatus Omnitrophica bacterium]|nr:hypothetical protein [Candidatus Omnitrophota bacterium]
MGSVSRSIRKLVWKKTGVEPADLMLFAGFSVIVTVILLVTVNILAQEYVDWKIICSGW